MSLWSLLSFVLLFFRQYLQLNKLYILNINILPQNLIQSSNLSLPLSSARLFQLFVPLTLIPQEATEYYWTHQL
jgi:hypothetical protein